MGAAFERRAKSSRSANAFLVEGSWHRPAGRAGTFELASARLRALQPHTHRGRWGGPAARPEPCLPCRTGWDDSDPGRALASLDASGWASARPLADERHAAGRRGQTRTEVWQHEWTQSNETVPPVSGTLNSSSLSFRATTLVRRCCWWGSCSRSHTRARLASPLYGPLSSQAR